MMAHELTITLKSFNELAVKCRDDREDLMLLMSIVDSIEDYHRSIIRENTYYALYADTSSDQNNFLEEYQNLDHARTAAHNIMLQHIVMLNNLASLYNMPLLYTGEISERQPYRRQVADAALGLLEEVIKNRI